MPAIVKSSLLFGALLLLLSGCGHSQSHDSAQKSAQQDLDRLAQEIQQTQEQAERIKADIERLRAKLKDVDASVQSLEGAAKEMKRIAASLQGQPHAKSAKKKEEGNGGAKAAWIIVILLILIVALIFAVKIIQARNAGGEDAWPDVGNSPPREERR